MFSVNFGAKGRPTMESKTSKVQSKKFRPSLTALNEYLDIAYQAAGANQGFNYHPSPSDRKICLLWASFCNEDAYGTLDVDKLAKLKAALHVVRNHNAQVDMEYRKVICQDGKVIEF